MAKRGRKPKESLERAIAGARRARPMRAHNAMIEAVNAGRYKVGRNNLPTGAIKVYATWHDAYEAAQRAGQRARAASGEASRAAARRHGISVTRVGQIRRAVLRGDRLLKQWQERDLFPAQERHNEATRLAIAAGELMRTAYADLHTSSPNPLAAALLRAHEARLEAERALGVQREPARKTQTQRAADELWGAYSGRRSLAKAK